MSEQAAIRAQALAYLKEELGSRAPEEITYEAEFSESPLDGEGQTHLFSFVLGDREHGCDPSAQKHFVAVGETTANYFPAHGLDADGAYSLHVGTRFMLVMRIQKVDAGAVPPNARPSLDHMLAAAAPSAKIENVELAALFRCEDEYFAVYRLEIDGRALYALAADCPPGFYEMTRVPPQFVLRLHIGQVIRAEARAQRRAEDGAA